MANAPRSKDPGTEIAVKPRQRSGAIRVLLIEDNIADRMLVERALSNHPNPFIVEAAIDKSDILRRFAADQAFDVLILDYKLSGFTGLDVMDWLQHCRLHIPVIMLTGTGTEEISLCVLQRGISDYIIKSQETINRLPYTVENVLQRFCAARAEHQSRQRLDRIQQQLVDAVESFPDGFELYDNTGHLVLFNQKYLDYCFPDDQKIRPDLSFSQIAERFIGSQLCNDETALQEIWNREGALAGNAFDKPVQYPLNDGRWLRTIRLRTRDGGMIGIHTDITEAHLMSTQLSYQATHDHLTGLLNRAEFERRLEMALITLQTEDAVHVLCYIDLDEFKTINDRGGHLAGDELLRQIGRLLRKHTRKSDTLARLGGDEFAVLFEYCGLPQAAKVADGLRKAVADFRFVWQEKPFVIGASMGLVPIESGSQRMSDVLSAADSACYAAKDQGRNRVQIYQRAAADRDKQSGEMRWFARIQEALEEGRLQLYAQPIARAEKTTTAAMYWELLLRLQDEFGIIVPAGSFLPAAERYKLSFTLDQWVVRNVLSWLAASPTRLRDSLFFLNLSMQSISDKGFLAFLSDELEASQVPASSICIELTETAAISNLDAALEFMRTMSERGCRFALDNFGADFSSFTFLKNLPVDFLKIDGSFIRNIAESSLDLALVKAINDISQAMGVRTIAELVEDDVIREKLAALNVDYVQGYAIGRPIPIEQVSLT